MTEKTAVFPPREHSFRRTHSGRSSMLCHGRTDKIFHVAFRSTLSYYQYFLHYSTSNFRCSSSSSSQLKMFSCICLMHFFHIDKSFLNKDQRYTCKVLQHGQQLACIYLESNSCFIKNKSLKTITSSTKHCMDNLLSQNLLLQTDVKAEPCLQYLDKSVEAVWTFYKPKWKTWKHRYLMGSQGKAGSIQEIRSHSSFM